ncbi:unnamed protein product [Penicillium bialowiezense]
MEIIDVGNTHDPMEETLNVRSYALRIHTNTTAPDYPALPRHVVHDGPVPAVRTSAGPGSVAAPPRTTPPRLRVADSGHPMGPNSMTILAAETVAGVSFRTPDPVACRGAQLDA